MSDPQTTKSEEFGEGYMDGYFDGRSVLIKEMVDRFLCWKLPEDFHPDCGILFDAYAAQKLNPRNHKYEPVGTNLFTATQAKAMVEHMLDRRPVAISKEEIELIGKSLEMFGENRDCEKQTDEAYKNLLAVLS